MPCPRTKHTRAPTPASQPPTQRLSVQVVGGLIQHQHVRVVPHGSCKGWHEESAQHEQGEQSEKRKVGQREREERTMQHTGAENRSAVHWMLAVAAATSRQHSATTSSLPAPEASHLPAPV
jgi:hypothetical protein